MKKTIALILSIVFVLSSLSTAFAEEVTVPEDEPIVEDYIDLSRITVSLQTNGNTASCYGSARTIVSTDSIHMWMYLQKQTSNGWTTVYSWYEQDVHLAVLDESRSGLSSGTYRLRLYVKVYDANGYFVESANVYSKLKTVS